MSVDKLYHPDDMHKPAKERRVVGWRIRWWEGSKQREQKVRKADGWTKKAADLVDLEMKKRKAHGLPTRTTRVTLGYVIGKFREQHMPGLRKKTQQSYDTHLKLRIEPLLGHLRMTHIDRARTREFIADMRKAKVPEPTIDSTLTLLGTVFNFAIEELELPVLNPMSRMSKARPKLQRRKHTHLDIEHVRALAAGAPTHRDAVMILTIGLSGLRISELVALRWTDIDSGAFALRVSQVRDVDGTIYQGSKGGRGTEAVTLHVELEEALERWRRDPDRRRRWVDCDLVFPATKLRKGPRSHAYMLDPHNWRKVFYKAVSNAAAAAASRVAEAEAAGRAASPVDARVAAFVPGTKGVIVHDVRAAYGYIVGRATGDVTERRDEMRHANVSVTVDQYGTRAPDARKRLRDALAASTRPGLTSA